MAAYKRYEKLKTQGTYAEAEPFARKALELAKAEYGPDHKNYSIYLNNLAALYAAQGRYGEAEPLLKRSLAVNRR